VSVPSSKAGSRLCGVRKSEAGEIPKRTYTIFKSRRKLEIYNINITLQPPPLFPPQMLNWEKIIILYRVSQKELYNFESV
jgi:hypothetical protein